MKDISANVIICGAGPSGLAAAAAAARLGKSVVLIEEDMQIGGAAIDCRVLRFDGRPYHGILAELNSEIHKMDPNYVDDEEDFQCCFSTGSYILAWKKMMQGLPITILNNSKIIAVKTIVINGKESIEFVETDRFRVFGDVFIDCTGTAFVASKTSCETRYGRESRHEFDEPEELAPEIADRHVQKCTLMYSLKRIKGAIVSANEPNWAHLNEDEFLMWGPTYECSDTTSEEELHRITELAYDKLLLDANKWIEKGYTIYDIAPKIGMREANRIIGDYTLSYNDIFGNKDHEDSICVGWHPVDIWRDSTKEIPPHMIEAPPYAIPYRCLVSSKVGNMLVAGRSISGTHIAMGSYRVMGIAAVLGQIAGLAAHIAIETATTTSCIDVNLLRDMAKKQGVLVDREDGFVPKYRGGEGRKIK